MHYDERSFFVYVMASPSGTIYVGMTNDLHARVAQHKERIIPGFTQKYGCTKLIYFEEFGDIEETILREKELKGWSRMKKERLIRKMNPTWFDLSLKW